MWCVLLSRGRLSRLYCECLEWEWGGGTVVVVVVAVGGLAYFVFGCMESVLFFCVSVFFGACVLFCRCLPPSLPAGCSPSQLEEKRTTHRNRIIGLVGVAGRQAGRHGHASACAPTRNTYVAHTDSSTRRRSGVFLFFSVCASEVDVMCSAFFSPHRPFGLLSFGFCFIMKTWSISGGVQDRG